MNRRDFLKASALTAGAVFLDPFPALTMTGRKKVLASEFPAAAVPAPDVSRRKVGKTGIELFPLGFDMMQVPGKRGGQFIEKESADILRHAIDSGVNYVDTAYVYGDSERTTGRALRDGYRERVYLATKSPIRMMNQERDFDRFLNEQLSRLQTDAIDFYMLHELRKESWTDVIMPFNLVERMEAAKKAGKIRFIGFSIHTDMEVLRQALDAYPHWDFCTIQLNYLDGSFQAGIDGLRYAADRGLAVMIMESLRSEVLDTLPGDSKSILAAANPVRTPDEWAFDYLWDMPGVSCVLSCIGDMKRVGEYVAYAERSSPGMLTAKERATFLQVVKRLSEYGTIPCTGCSYCVPCPTGIAIPQHFAIYNRYKLTGDQVSCQKQFETEIPAWGEYATLCIDCGLCETLCPQRIKIPDMLPSVLKSFTV